MKQSWNVKKIALIGIMGGLAGALMYLKFPLPFMPPFMDFDFSSIPEVIGGFALGPVAAVLIIIVKLLVKLALMGTSTMFVGELSNFLVSCSFVLPAVIIYQRNRTKKGALIGMLVGLVSVLIVSCITNIYFIVPFFISAMNLSMEAIINMCNAINPLITSVATFALFGVVPFNFIKYGVVGIVTYILYKRVSGQIKKFVS